MQRFESAIVGVRCGVKSVDMKMTKDLMQLFDLEETMGKPAKGDSVCWNGHLLRKDKNNVIRTSDF